jgi:cytochrome c553
MRSYSAKISLIKNSRGVYCLDTSIGCKSGMESEIGGCYNDCYAAKSAKTYGYDFSKTVLRHFENEFHRRQIVSEINRIPLSFVRIGCSGDPSENWNHCILILKAIDKCNKQIVIITKHWTELSDSHLEYFKTINICINTSVSALDKPELLARSLAQYERLKKVCKSVLRVVSCNFNMENETGKRLSEIQDELFKNDSIIDTVFRPSKKNPLVVDGVIKVKAELFNGNKQLASKYSRKTYMGKCGNCHEMCGASMVVKNRQYPEKPRTLKQLSIFGKSKQSPSNP